MTARPHKPIAWTLNKASVEFGVDGKTLRMRLANAGQHPGPDGKFTTRQLCDGLFGGERSERGARTKAERQLAELQFAKASMAVLPAQGVHRAWAHLLQGVRSRWLQLPARAVLAFSLWRDARAAEAWLEKEVESLLADLATNPDYSAPDEDDDEEPGATAA